MGDHSEAGHESGALAKALTDPREHRIASLLLEAPPPPEGGPLPAASGAGSRGAGAAGREEGDGDSAQPVAGDLVLALPRTSGGDGASKLDFIGPANAVKALFSMPFQEAGSTGSVCLAVHRIGDTIIFEDAKALQEIAATALEHLPATTIERIRQQAKSLLTGSLLEGLPGTGGGSSGSSGGGGGSAAVADPGHPGGGTALSALPMAASPTVVAMPGSPSHGEAAAVHARVPDHEAMPLLLQAIEEDQRALVPMASPVPMTNTMDVPTSPATPPLPSPPTTTGAMGAAEAPLVAPGPTLFPPAEWTPPFPSPPLRTLDWKLHDFRLVLGSDVPVHSTQGRPAVSVRMHEEGRQWEACTALDAYLDNIMANIPELALCLESKGFISGYKLMPTAAIPYADVSAPGGGSPTVAAAPLFNTKDVELNASMLLRFLQANCKRDGATYLLQREPRSEGEEEKPAGPDVVRLYDLSAMSGTPSRKWRWLLAMLSFRFATRLEHYTMPSSHGAPDETILHRQRELLETCLQLLQELKDMGSSSHDMIRATVHELLAKSFLRPEPTAPKSPQETRSFPAKSQGSSSAPEAVAAGAAGAAATPPASTPPRPSSPPAVSPTKSAPPQGSSTLAAPPTSPSQSKGLASFLESSLTADEEDVSEDRSTEIRLARWHAVQTALRGWPGVEDMKALDGSSDQDLDKALSHLSCSLKILSAMPLQEEDKPDPAPGVDERKPHAAPRSGIEESVQEQLSNLHCRTIEVALTTASRQLAKYQASSTMSQLRGAALSLVALRSVVESSAKMEDAPLLPQQLRFLRCEAWLWQLGAEFSRSVAQDRFGWVEKAGIHPADILAFLSELDNIVRPRRDETSMSLAPVHFHFSDPFSWQQYRDVWEDMASATAEDFPAHGEESLGAAAVSGSKHPRGKGRRQRKGSHRPRQAATDEPEGSGGQFSPHAGNDGDEEDLAFTPYFPENGQPPEDPAHPVPLLVACSLCVARSLLPISSIARCRDRLVAAYPDLSTAPAAPEAATLEGAGSLRRNQGSPGDGDNPLAATVTVLLRQLGGACNLVGQALLALVPRTMATDVTAAEAAAAVASAMASDLSASASGPSAPGEVPLEPAPVESSPPPATAPSTPVKRTREEQRMFAAQAWFHRGLRFLVASKDWSNAALVLCNLASARKLQAGRLPRAGRHSAWLPPRPGAPVVAGDSLYWSQPRPVGELVEGYLSQAIADCSLAMEYLNERGTNPVAWDHVASELAMAYLSLGVRRRQALLDATAQDQATATAASPAGAAMHPRLQSVTPGAAQRVAEPLEKAARIYEDLGDTGQLAATRFQAGTLWSRLWMMAPDPRRATERLAKALAHYQAAHTFYLSTGGHTLAVINLEMSDLYQAVHGASASGNRECLHKALFCLLETHRTFNAATLEAAGATVPQLQELLRLGQLLIERLQKLLLRLVRASPGSDLTQQQDVGSQPPAPGTAGTPNQHPGAPETAVYKELYRDALRFQHPERGGTTRATTAKVSGEQAAPAVEDEEDLSTRVGRLGTLFAEMNARLRGASGSSAAATEKAPQQQQQQQQTPV